jgi:hypothetical protein
MIYKAPPDAALRGGFQSEEATVNFKRANATWLASTRTDLPFIKCTLEEEIYCGDGTMVASSGLPSSKSNRGQFRVEERHGHALFKPNHRTSLTLRVPLPALVKATTGTISLTI